jgi:hypothetical protein
MIHCKPEGRKKRDHPRKTWKDEIYTAMNERDLRMGEWNNRRQWKSEGVVRGFKTAQKECARLRKGVLYVKVYRYNPKHLYP